MKFRLNRFNIYLLLVLAPVLICGCQSPESKKKRELASISLHLETNPDRTDRSETVPVLREHSFPVNIEKTAFINEAHLAEASVIDAMGGFALRLKFDRQGTWLLEQYTAQYAGRRVAIFAQFGEKMKEARWLAAPVMGRRVTDGVLTFTPDATRGEADEIVLGLNNVAKKLQDKKSSWE